MADRRGSSSRVTFVAVVALAIALGIVIVSVVAARQFAQTRLERSAEQRVEQAAALAAVSVRENLDRITARATAVARSEALRRALREDDVAAQFALARAMQQETDGARVAFVVTPDAKVAAMHPLDRSVLGVSYAERDWYRGVLDETPYLSEVYEIAAFEQPRAVSIAARVEDGGTLLGIVTIVVEAEQFGSAILRASRTPDAPELELIDQNGQRVVATAPRRGATVSARRTIAGGSGWELAASLSKADAYRDLRTIRNGATVFAVALSLLLLLVGALLLLITRRLLHEQRRSERREQAFELNDTIVQRLAVAKLSLELGRVDEAQGALGEALEAGIRIVGDLADDRHDFVRDTAASDTPEPGRLG